MLPKAVWPRVSHCTSRHPHTPNGHSVCAPQRREGVHRWAHREGRRHQQMLRAECANSFRRSGGHSPTKKPPRPSGSGSARRSEGNALNSGMGQRARSGKAGDPRTDDEDPIDRPGDPARDLGGPAIEMTSGQLNASRRRVDHDACRRLTVLIPLEACALGHPRFARPRVLRTSRDGSRSARCCSEAA